MCRGEEFKILGRRLNQSQGRNPRRKTGIAVTVVKCMHCGLKFPNPLPIPLDIAEHYGIDPEKYWTGIYLHVNEDSFAPLINRLQKLLPFSKGQKTLDVGAGLGHLMKGLQKNGYDSYGVEPSEPFYSSARERYSISEEYLKNTTIEEAEFENAFFDFVTFGAVLEHLYDPDYCLQKALAWLRPGGIIHMEVPNADWLSAKLFNLYYKLTLSGFVANLSPMHPPYHLYEFTRDSFEKHGLLNGYEIIFYDVHTCQTYMPGILDRPLRRYMDHRKKGMQLEVWLRKKAIAEEISI